MQHTRDSLTTLHFETNIPTGRFFVIGDCGDRPLELLRIVYSITSGYNWRALAARVDWEGIGMADREQEHSKSVEQFRRLVKACKPGEMVFFGGAGVSTESGIPDFCSPSGLYAQKYAYPPEVMVSHSFFEAHPKEFFDFYCDRMLALDAKPNTCHRKLADLEREGICRAVITQNIDGLHQAAGSKNVIELHGSVHRNHCVRCGRAYSVYELLDAHAASEDGVPRCQCGGIIKPDVVLYEEPLNDEDITHAVHAIARAGLLVVGGTSLNVYPAAGLVQYFQGSHLVVINLSTTSLDKNADLCIAQPIGEVFNF